MGKGLALAVASIVLLGGAAAPALSAPSDALPAGSLTYTDTAGESGIAPDLGPVTVTPDAAGQLSFHIVAAGFPRQPLTGDQSEEVFVCIDADRNIGTGSAGGGCDFEFWVFKDRVLSQQLWFASYVNGVRQPTQSPPDVTLTGTGDDFTVSFPAAKIGSPSSFNFYVYSDRVNVFDGASVARDFAPDHGWWTFPSTPPVGHVAQTGTSGTPFTEAAADGQGPIDVSSVVLSDAAAAAVTFAFSISGMKPDPDGETAFYVDADHNPATGEEGREFEVTVSDDPLFGWLYLVYRWNGASWEFEDIGEATATVAAPVDNVTLTVPRSDLGGSNGFDFYILAANYNANGDAAVARDDAPDTQWWTFTPVQLTASQLAKPVFGKPHVVGKPVGGKKITVTYPVKRSDNGAAFPVTSVLGLGPAIGETLLPEKYKVGLGFVRWTIAIPKGRRGQWIQLRFGAADAYQAAFTAKSFRIR